MNIKTSAYCLLLLVILFAICKYTTSFINSPKQNATFVLLTDFGNDFAVGSIKGVILSKLPRAIITDLDHTITKFNIISGGFVLSKAYRYFPQGTIFICVVDPGVGTQREPICISTPDYTFIGPNNGIFDYVLEQEKSYLVYRIKETYLAGKGSTFHGRDLFAPAAVDFYLGDLTLFEPFSKQNLVHIKLDSAAQVFAVYIDSFGNIKTDKSLVMDNNLRKNFTLKVKDKSYLIPFVKTFKEVPTGELLGYIGSNGTLEIAVNQGSASEKLKISVGDTILVKD